MVIVVTEERQKQFIYSSNPPFWSLNLETALLFEEMLVLTSY